MCPGIQASYECVEVVSQSGNSVVLGCRRAPGGQLSGKKGHFTASSTCQGHSTSHCYQVLQVTPLRLGSDSPLPGVFLP